MSYEKPHQGVQTPHVLGQSAEIFFAAHRMSILFCPLFLAHVHQLVRTLPIVHFPFLSVQLTTGATVVATIGAGVDGVRSTSQEVAGGILACNLVCNVI